MNNLKQVSRLSLAIALLAGTGLASAQSLNVGSASVPSASGGNASITVQFNPEGASVSTYFTVFEYDDSILTGDPVATNGTATCTVDPGTSTVSVFRATLPASAIPAEQACSIAFNVTAGTPVNAYPFVLSANPNDTGFGDLVGAALDGEVNLGAINVVDVGPPTISFDETPIVLAGVYGTVQVDTVTVTLTDGGGNDPADTASYTCTAPAGISVSPLTGGPVANGGSLTDLSVSCTLGDTEVSGNIECNATNTAGSDEDFTIPVTCEAGTMAPPILTPTPGNGSTITTGAGAPGQVGTGALVVTPSGGAGVDPATITCSPSTASLTVSPAGVQSFLPGAAARTFSVGCTLTQEPQEFMGGVTCAGTDGNGPIEWSFDVSCPAGVIAPTFVPASSLWSKLALFGIFAALGLLVLGLRRNH